MLYLERLIRLAKLAYNHYEDVPSTWDNYRESSKRLARFNKINWHLTWNTGPIGNPKSLSTFRREGHPLAQ